MIELKNGFEWFSVFYGGMCKIIGSGKDEKKDLFIVNIKGDRGKNRDWSMYRQQILDDLDMEWETI